MSTEAEFKATLQANAASSAASLTSQNGAVASITGSVSFAADVKAQFDYYSQYTKGMKFPKTLDQGKEFTEKVLTNYAKANAKKWGADVIKKVAGAYGAEGYVPDSIPTNEKEALAAATDIACVAASEELGVDPRIAKVTVEAVIDGKLDKHDAEAIGSLAGSIAGAAACQMFGIPAPIGAFLGGELGGWIGGEVADIFGASKKAHREWLKKQRAIVAQIHAQAEQACGVVREGYWATFDSYVAQAERTWENMELNAGGLFDLRWFGRTPNYAFLQFAQQQPKLYTGRTGPQSCDVVCMDGSVIKTTPTPYTTSLTNNPQAQLALYNQCKDKAKALIRRRYPGATDAKIIDMIATDMLKGHDPIDSCGMDCLADYGCLYPDMSSYTQYPSTVADGLASPRRVCSAYYALGFAWQAPPPASEVPAYVVAKLPPWRATACSLPVATDKEITDSKVHRKLWVDWLNALIAGEEQRITNLNSASVRLFGDLAQTAAMVAVERKLSDSKTLSTLHGLGGSDAAITSASSWVNNGALVAGLGWLAYNARKR